MVAAHHYAIHLAPSYGKAVVQSLELGRMAVLLFFVLSGFVICEAVAAFYRGRPTQFIANRMLRIVPPFAAVLVASCVIEGALFASGLLHPLEGGPVSVADLGLGNCLKNLLSILPGSDISVLRPRYDINRYIWAVRVEVVFYLVVFGCAALTTWRGGQRRERTRIGLGTWLGLAGLTLSIGSVAAKTAGHGTGAFEFAPYFALGGAWFYVVSGTPGERLPAVSLAAASAILAAAHYTMAGTGGWFVARASLLILLTLTAAWLSTRRRVSGTALRVDRKLGSLCYPIYLLQFLGGTIVSSLLPSGAEVMRFAAAVGVTLVLSVLLEAAVEPALAGIRSRLRRAPAPGSSRQPSLSA